MENSNATAVPGLEFWVQWQVLVCGLIILLATVAAFILIRDRPSGAGVSPLKPTDLWAPCWRNLHPRWLLLFRGFAFATMAFLLYLTVVDFGSLAFFFYTQWTFALVMVYFGLATIVSARGCRIHAKGPYAQSGEMDGFLKKDSEEINYETNETSKEKNGKGSTNLAIHHNPDPNEQQVGFLGNLLQIIYLICPGAVMLTDIVFWCLLLPFMLGENFQLTLLLGLMHSVNAIFLLIESALNRMQIPWFGIVYVVLWTAVYVVFQWVLHACCMSWWPYPFLDLSTPSAPLWYLGLQLVLVPCYGLYLLLVKAMQAALSRMFPHTYVRDLKEKKRV